MRQRISVPANFQIASKAESTATRMQPLVVQNEMLRTISGFRKPRFFLRGCELSKLTSAKFDGSKGFVLPQVY